jgi:hypothetical protein
MHDTHGHGLDGVIQLARHQGQSGIDGSGRPLEPERITHKVCR